MSSADLNFLISICLAFSLFFGALNTITLILILIKQSREKND